MSGPPVFIAAGCPRAPDTVELQAIVTAHLLTQSALHCFSSLACLPLPTAAVAAATACPAYAAFTLPCDAACASCPPRLMSVATGKMIHCITGMKLTATYPASHVVQSVNEYFPPCSTSTTE